MQRVQSHPPNQPSKLDDHQWYLHLCHLLHHSPNFRYCQRSQMLMLRAIEWEIETVFDQPKKWCMSKAPDHSEEHSLERLNPRLHRPQTCYIDGLQEWADLKN
jgi:hypothetical protein